MVQKLSILAIAVLLFAISQANATPMRLIGAMKGANWGDNVARACEGLGDINGDGNADFLFSQRGQGLLYLYWGGPHPLNNPPAFTWTNYTTLYLNPTNVGDVNCDGVNDFIAAFDYADSIKLFTGMGTLDTSKNLVLFTDDSPGQDHWTYRFCGDGDNNNDGRAEFWLYRDDMSNNDTIRGYIGCEAIDSIPDMFIVRLPNPGHHYIVGKNICNTCDLNGDLTPDIVWGEYDGSETVPGRACITWGGTNLSNAPDVVFYGRPDDVRNYLFGVDIACLGDISGDGIDDLWVQRFGRGYIYFGGQPFDTMPDVVVDYPYMKWVENVGDINNDGWNDVLLAYPEDFISHISFIYCSPDMDTLVDVIYTEQDYRSALLNIGITASVSYLGTSYSRAGDIDGDGINDALIGSFTSMDEQSHGILFVQAGWDSIPTDVSDDPPPAVPDHMELKQNYPNPFNPGTNIEFTLPRAGYTEVKIYNLLGEIVAIPLKQYLPAGNHRIAWDGLNLDGQPAASGIYFYRLTAGEYSHTRKMVLMK